MMLYKRLNIELLREGKNLKTRGIKELEFTILVALTKPEFVMKVLEAYLVQSPLYHLPSTVDVREMHKVLVDYFTL